MKELYSLKDKLLDELIEHSKMTDFSHNDIENIRNLASGILKICEICDVEEEKSGFSNRRSYGRGSYGSYNSYSDYDDGSYEGMSNRRKRDAMGRFSRESGYSRDDDMMSKLYDIMEEAPEHKKKELKQMIERLERM